ncbi:MAG TPA: acyl-CoA dehydrogenase family protein [Usitatibacteraceae bacterium]|nr:acyl-CoA dehydrogenase family protein [Usitatibacteraceae bacterium]
MIPRTLFSEEHDAFRDAFRRFLEQEAKPFHEQWEEQGYVSRELWTRAGAHGFLCASMPEAHGGAGGDARYSMIEMEELGRAGLTGIGFSLHSEIVAPYILHHGTQDQKARYLPRLASGEMIGAIAMTDPAAGSDLQGIQTRALRSGGHFVLNGAKTFITNGWHADLVIVVAKTNPAEGAKGISLFLVERGMRGFERGRRLKKLGLKAQDTAELFFNDVKVPAENLLGGAQGENRGFAFLMQELPWERLQIAITAVSSAQAAIDWTVEYVKQRKAFGQPIGNFQNTRYKLAELQTEVQIAQVFIDRCMEMLLAGPLDSATASMAKYWCTDLQCKVMDECVQLHGGYGYMWEYPITRAFADARVQRIYGGTNEIMKELISRSMGLNGRV